MLISDWGSYVCSSDLLILFGSRIQLSTDESGEIKSGISKLLWALIGHEHAPTEMFRWMDEMGIHRWVSHRARSAASLRNSSGTHESTITLNRISSPDKTGENPQQISGFPPTSVSNGANVAAMDNPLDDWFEREILVHEAARMRYLLRWWPHRDDVPDLRQEIYIRKIGRAHV